MKRPIAILTAAAALLLGGTAHAGWYLLAPPTSDTQLMDDAPLRYWGIIGSYDSATDCRAAQNALIEWANRPIDPAKLAEASQVAKAQGRYLVPQHLLFSRMVSSQCVEINDPQQIPENNKEEIVK